MMELFQMEEVRKKGVGYRHRQLEPAKVWGQYRRSKNPASRVITQHCRRLHRTLPHLLFELTTHPQRPP